MTVPKDTWVVPVYEKFIERVTTARPVLFTLISVNGHRTYSLYYYVYQRSLITPFTTTFEHRIQTKRVWEFKSDQLLLIKQTDTPPKEGIVFLPKTATEPAKGFIVEYEKII